jgi:hypothetical protein
MGDKVESFQDRNSVGAWGSSITSFRSALGKALGKGVCCFNWGSSWESGSGRWSEG